MKKKNEVHKYLFYLYISTWFLSFELLGEKKTKMDLEVAKERRIYLQ